MEKDLYEKRPWLNCYNHSSPADIDISQDKTLITLFNEAADKWANKTAIVFYGRKITFRELKDKVDRLAAALSDLEIKKGDRIALLLLNSPEFIISYFAAIKIGAVQTQISPVYVSSEIKHQLVDSGSETIICQDILYEGVQKTGIKLKNVILTNISESLPKIKKFMGTTILRGIYQKMAAPVPDIYEREGIYLLPELLTKYPPMAPEIQINSKEDIALLPYTGGTTGSPKGVMLTHYNIVSNYYQNCAALVNLEYGKEAIVGFMPFYHAAGSSGLNLSIFSGFTLVVVTTPDIDDIIEYLITYKASYFFASPTMFEMLKDYEKTDRVNWKKMKMIESGADALNEYTAKDWEERTGTKITEAYGMTEATALTHMNPQGKQKYGSVGIPVSSTYAAILDPDEDKYLPVGEIGEIVVDGPQLTIGYWGRPEATKECEAIMDGRRYWRTGDLGKMDEDGYFYVYDRKRDLIKYKGLRIFAREVEEVLKDHPSIKEVGVVGVPDRVVGQNVKAIIVLESDARGKLSEREILEYCQDKLAHYKIPKIIEFVGEIPKTDIGKVSRREMRTEEE